MAQPDTSGWPDGDSEMATRIRAHDWAATPLGPLKAWPERLRVVVELVLASPLLSSVAVGPQRLLLYNDAAARFYGERHPAALGRPLAETFPESFPTVADLYDRVFAGEAVSVAAQPLDIRQDDAGEMFDAYLTPVMGDTGAVLAAHMTGIEVGDRARADAALRESEARHSLLIGSWAQAVWETDAEGVVVADSPSWRAYTGQTLDEWLGYGWLDAIHPDDRAYAERQWREAMAARSLVDAEFRLRAPDSGWRWTNLRAAPVLDADGCIVKWAGLNVDIDARKRAEAALRESERTYRGLFETMGQGYVEAEVVRDAEGRAVDSRLIELNPAFERLTGVPVAAARGRTNREIFPGIEDWWAQTADRVVRSGAPETVEYAVTPLDRYYQVHFYPTAGNRYTAIYEDITDRKRAEKVLRESGERQAFLLKLADALRPLAGPMDVPRIASRILGERLDADRVAYAEFDPDEDTARLLFEYTAAGVSPLTQDHYRWSDFDPAGHARGRLGESFSRADVQKATDLTPAQKAVFAAVGFGAFINVPLVKSGRLVAFIAIHWQHPHDVEQAEIELAEETAERTWAAVERARAEAALRESEERFRRFGEASQDILWIRDADTLQWTYLTPAFEAIYGLSREEALAGNNYRSWMELIVPEDRPNALENIRRVQAGEQVAFESRIRRPSDGAIRWLQNTDFPIRNKDGRVMLIGGVGHDLTELRETELRLRALMEGIPQLVWRAVGDGHRTWASPQWTAFTGQAEAESHEWGWLATLHADDRDAARQVWSHAVERGHVEVEYRICGQEAGAYRWFQSRATPVRDEAGAIIEWLGTSTDIHDLRLLQDRQQVMVKELQHRTRNLIAVVGALSSQTMKNAVSLGDFDQRFGHRLSALSRVQGLLSHLSAGKKVAFDELLRSELSALGAPDDKVTLDGPIGVPLRSATVQTFSLALHELATNALKYGALIAPEGHLTVRWSVAHVGDEPRLLVDWRESGVAMAHVGDRPRGGGYGRELIEQALPYQLDAETMYEMTADGVHCTIDVPIPKAQTGLDGRFEQSVA